MHPFELPEFYMPYPARLNPHLEGARAHSRAWAHAVGILSSGGDSIWDEKTFDAMDFALFTAHTHPDVHAQELNTLTDWYVWGWYVDDFVAQAYEQSQDLKAARDYLGRLPAFMPAELVTAVPAPENPMEQALVDLWPRTAPSMSPAWRRRYVEHIVQMAEAGLRDIWSSTLGEPRVLDPIEYVSTRRVTSGMMWSADLVEHSLGAEIPAHLYDTRPIRVLNETFFDSVAVRNDIISYPRDVAEGKVNNAVMVTRELLGSDLQHAVDVVNDLVSSRLFQFENTLLTEVESLFEEHLLDPAARFAVLRYVKGLQDWMGGDFEWETRPGGRYLPADPDGLRDDGPLGGPTGAGTSAAHPRLRRLLPGLQRLKSLAFVPFQHVETIALPDLYAPYPVRVNVHVDEARASTKDWFREMGILEAYSGGPSVLWNEHVFDSQDLAHCAAICVPDGSRVDLELTALWYAWGSWANDYFTVYHRRPYESALAQTRRISLCLPLDGAPAPPPANVLERSLQDLWLRTLRALPRDVHRPLREHVEAMFGVYLWESFNLHQNRLPDIVDYVEMRAVGTGVQLMMFMATRASAEVLSTALLKSPTMHSLERAAADHFVFTNDIFSYMKEIEYEGDFHNGVRALENLLGVDHRRGTELLAQLMEGRMRQFEHVVDKELPALMVEHQLDDKARASLENYATSIRNVIMGNLEWCKTTGRYDPTEVRENCAASRAARAHTGFDPWALRASLSNVSSRMDERASEPPPTAPTLRIPHRFPALPALPARDKEPDLLPPRPLASPGAPEIPPLTGLGTHSARLFQVLAEAQTSAASRSDNTSQ